MNAINQGISPVSPRLRLPALHYFSRIETEPPAFSIFSRAEAVM